MDGKKNNLFGKKQEADADLKPTPSPLHPESPLLSKTDPDSDSDPIKNLADSSDPMNDPVWTSGTNPSNGTSQAPDFMFDSVKIPNLPSPTSRPLTTLEKYSYPEGKVPKLRYDGPRLFVESINIARPKNSKIADSDMRLSPDSPDLSTIKEASDEQEQSGLMSYFWNPLNKLGQIFGMAKKDQEIFKGTYDEQGRKQGYGKLYYKNKVKQYKGQFKDGLAEGVGKSFYENGVVQYEGNWCKGKKNEYGICYRKNGTRIYKGFIINDMQQGQGTSYCDVGVKRYKGEFSNGVQSGYGIEYDQDSKVAYEGCVDNGDRCGEGCFEKDQPHGVGKRYYQDLQGKEMVLYHGKFFNGSTHGQGVLFHENGLKRYEGEWYMGDPVGPGKWFDLTGTQELWSGTPKVETED